MPDFETDGVSVWRTTNETGAIGMCITNLEDDDSPSVSIYLHKGEVAGCLVRDGTTGGIIARWGLVDSEFAE